VSRAVDEHAFEDIDDINAARFCRPSLTTIPSRPFVVGTLAAATLIDLMSGRVPEERNRLLETELVVRGSTDGKFDETV
jgi:DNA-binding LacI/PurR family transcriptional regulator